MGSKIWKNFHAEDARCVFNLRKSSSIIMETQTAEFIDEPPSTKNPFNTDVVGTSSSGSRYGFN